MNAILCFPFIIILIVEFIVGNFGNAFMALVNILDWVKRRTISLTDLILTALAISRITFLWSIITNVLIYVLYPNVVKTRQIVKTINIGFTVTNHFSIWLATCLSIFYLLRIAQFSSSLFLYLKWRVNKVVSLTFLASLLILFINIILLNSQIDIWINEYKKNLSYNFNSDNYLEFYKRVSLTNPIFTFMPFSVSLITFLLLIFSLLKHLKSMQHNAKGSRDISTTAHIKALQNVIAFLLLYTIFFISYISLGWNTDAWHKSMFIFLGVTLIVFPSGHSCVLILGNTKLRQAFLSLLRWLRFRFKEVALSDP